MPEDPEVEEEFDFGKKRKKKKAQPKINELFEEVNIVTSCTARTGCRSSFFNMQKQK